VTSKQKSLLTYNTVSVYRVTIADLNYVTLTMIYTEFTIFHLKKSYSYILYRKT